MEVREQNRDQQKNGILGSLLPQAMPDSGDTEGHGRSSLTEDLKDHKMSLLRTSDEGINMWIPWLSQWDFYWHVS